MSSSSRAARAAVVLSVPAVLAIPAAVLGSRYLSGIRLLQALYVAVPVACAFGVLAVAAARRARWSAARSVRPEAAGPLRLGRLLAWTGLYVGLTGALALAVYGVLRWAQ